MADSDPASAVRSGTASPREDAATKSAREELKHTAISEKAADTIDPRRAMTPDATPQLKPPGQYSALNEQVSSPKKKRAHDQVDDDDTTATEGNKKNKDDHDQNNDEADTSAVTVATTGSAATSASSAADAPDSSVGAEPDKKRPRDETAMDEKDAKDARDTTKDANSAEDTDAAAGAPASSFASSGFAKLTSTASPFGTLGGAGGAAKPSLFGAASATATTFSSASPFGSTFASAAKPSTAATVTVPTLSFGSSGAASPFAGLQGAAPSSQVFGSAFGSASSRASTGFGGGSGFGGGGGSSSVFGSALSGPKLTSFAKPGESFKSGKPARPFGAPESEPEESGDEDSAAEEDENGDEAEGDDDGAEGDEKAKASGEEKKKRLQRVVIDDGETGEATLLQVRARMYYHDKDLGWKERGAGMLKVNVPEQCVEYDRDGSVIPASFDASTLGGDADADDDANDDAGSDDANGSQSDLGASAKPKAGSGLAALPQRTMVRLIMRQDSTHRVILNTVVLATTEFKDRQTLKATTVLFTAFEGEDAKPVTVQAKMNIANAKTFLTTMEGIQRELRAD